MRKKIAAYIGGRRIADEMLEVANDGAEAIEQAKAKIAERLSADERAEVEFRFEEYGA